MKSVLRALLLLLLARLVPGLEYSPEPPGAGTPSPADDDPVHLVSEQTASDPETPAGVMNPDAREETSSAGETIQGDPAEAPAESDHDDPGPRIRREGVPAGFEAWEEPQTTAVDLYYGGRFRTTTLAEYTLEEVRFLNPEEVAEAVPTLHDPEALADYLSRPLPPNSDRVCVEPDEAGCGYLEPDIAGIIFDETRFRVDLFVHPELLEEVAREPRYLSDPDRERPSLVQNLSATHSASSATDNRFSLFGRTRAGYGTGHGFANWVSTDRQSLSVDEAGWHQDLLNHQVRTGLFEPRVDALRALSRQPILGASLATSMNRRRDRDAVISSPIELYLPSRARVDVFREERLVSSGFYEAGNQEIDTSRLPPGAYEVDIVITDVDGRVRTERELFVKSAVLAPPGESLWFAEAGQVMQRNPRELFPEDRDEFLGRGGYRWRQYDWLGLGVAGAGTTEAALGEISAGVLRPGFQADGEVFASSEGGWGHGMRGTTRWRNLVASASVRRTHADDPPDEDEQRYRLLPSEQHLRTLQLSHPLGQGQLVATGSESRRTDGDRLRRASLRYRRTMPIGGGQTLSLSTEAAVSDGDRRLVAGIQWRMRHSQWTHSAALRMRDTPAESESDGLEGSLATSWRDGSLFVDDVDATLRVDGDRDRQSLGASGQHRSQFGRGRLSASAVDGTTGQRALAASTYDTSLVVGESGTTAMGGPAPNGSGVILDLTDAPDGLFDVIVNGQRQFTARGGRRAVVTLPPYEEYRIRLADRGLEMVRFDEEPRDVTLYPGNVATLKWDLRPVHVLIGRLVTPQEVCLAHVDECYTVNAPVADGRIEGAEGFAFTDPDGFFQADVREGVEELRVRHPEGECRASLEDVPERHGVLRASELVCMPDDGEHPETQALP